MKSSQDGPILSIVELAWTSYPKLVAAIAASGATAGFVGILLVDAINAAIHAATVGPALNLRFGLLILLYIAINSLVLLLPAFLSNKVNVLLRQRLCEQFIAAPLEDLERRGLPELLTLLNLDTPTIAQTTLILPFVVANISILVFGTLYIFYKAPLVFLVVLIGILIGGLAYYACYKKGVVIARQASDEYELLNDNLHGLVCGIKELKLNRQRRARFRKEFFQSTEKAARFRFLHQIWFSAAEMLGQFFYLLILSALLLGVPALIHIDPAVITSCLFCILFMMGPLSSLSNLLPEIGKGSVALERMYERGFPVQKPSKSIEGPNPNLPRAAAHWHSITLVDIEAKYSGDSTEGNGFQLGPINLTISPGELVYVIGGNGSGKSTLARVLDGSLSTFGGRHLFGRRACKPRQYRGLSKPVFCSLFGLSPI